MVGLKDMAPFDAIVIAAAFGEVPEALKQQLADGGRLVMPLGSGTQTLCVVERDGKHFHEQQLEAVKFVPLLPGVA